MSASHKQNILVEARRDIIILSSSVVYTLFSVQHLIALLTSLQRHLHRNISGKIVSRRINSVYLNVRSLHFLDKVSGRHPTISKYCHEKYSHGFGVFGGFHRIVCPHNFTKRLIDRSHSSSVQTEPGQRRRRADVIMFEPEI